MFGGLEGIIYNSTLGGGEGIVLFFGETIHRAASARWSASAVGMLGVVLPGGLRMGEVDGSSALGWEKESGGGGLVPLLE